jgi:hypothetical protein
MLIEAVSLVRDRGERLQVELGYVLHSFKSHQSGVGTYNHVLMTRVGDNLRRLKGWVSYNRTSWVLFAEDRTR